MKTASSYNVSLAHERTAPLGPFDPERYVKGLEALGDIVKATIGPDGRQGYYNVSPNGVGRVSERLALEIWNGSDPRNFQAVIRYLISSGRVEIDPHPTLH